MKQTCYGLTKYRGYAALCFPACNCRGSDNSLLQRTDHRLKGPLEHGPLLPHAKSKEDAM